MRLGKVHCSLDNSRFNNLLVQMEMQLVPDEMATLTILKFVTALMSGEAVSSKVTSSLAIEDNWNETTQIITDDIQYNKKGGLQFCMWEIHLFIAVPHISSVTYRINMGIFKLISCVCPRNKPTKSYPLIYDILLQSLAYKHESFSSEDALHVVVQSRL